MERASRTKERPLTNEWEVRQDPDFFEAHQNIYEKALLDGKELPRKYRELIVMTIHTIRGLEGVSHYMG